MACGTGKREAMRWDSTLSKQNWGEWKGESGLRGAVRARFHDSDPVGAGRVRVTEEPASLSPTVILPSSTAKAGWPPPMTKGARGSGDKEGLTKCSALAVPDWLQRSGEDSGWVVPRALSASVREEERGRRGGG